MTIKKGIYKTMTIILYILGLLISLLIIGVINTRLQHSRYQQYWDKLGRQTPPPNALILVALGDSTAQAIGASSPLKGYVGLVAKRLESDTNKPVHIINISKTGAKIGDVLDEQLPRLKGLKPDLVTIEIGANDVANFDADKFKSQVESLVTQLPKDTYMSDVPYFGSGLFRSRQPAVDEANAIIYKAIDNRPLKLVKLHQVTKELDSPATFATDLFHPSNVGYKNWAEAFYGVIKKDFSKHD